MSAQILDGKKFAAKLNQQTADGIKKLADARGVRPGLGVVLVGDDPASVSYVTAKERACDALGIYSEEHRLPADAMQDRILAIVRSLNKDPAIHGILVQLPLPKGIDEDVVVANISPEKDVDGFTPVNVGRMIIGQECFIPCTPHGIIQLLMDSGIETSGRHAVVVGRSNIVGKPVSHLLMRKATGGNATVTVCHTGTRDLASFTKSADILVVAAGRPQTVTGEMVKPGAAVIDVGVNRVPDAAAKRGYRLVGDVDFDSVSAVAGCITPVPGGVGPLTIAMLMRNTLEAAERAAGGSAKKDLGE